MTSQTCLLRITEGIDWVNSLPQNALAAIMIDYIKKEQHISKLRNAIENVNLPDIQKDTISKILAAGGARTALNFDIFQYKKIK